MGICRVAAHINALHVTSLGLALVVLGLAITGMAILAGDAAAGHSPTPQNFKVAFIGDQGLRSTSVAVLNLIRDEGADMVLHQGDLGYSSDYDAWDQQITDALGSDFPYFAVVGNHDCCLGVQHADQGEWPPYQQKLLARLDRIDGATCTGDLGVVSACSYQGLFFILSGIGLSTLGSGIGVPDADHLVYIRDQLAATTPSGVSARGIWSTKRWRSRPRGASDWTRMMSVVREAR